MYRRHIDFMLNFGAYFMLIPDAPPLSEMAEGNPLLPEQSFNFRCHKAEYVAVPKGKDAKGPYIKCQHVVTGPGETKYLGRYVFMNYSLTGDGSFRLRELLTVSGKPNDYKLGDDQELVGLEFGGAIGTEKGTGSYADKSVIKKHLPLLATQG